MTTETKDTFVNGIIKGPFLKRRKNGTTQFDKSDNQLFKDAVYQGYLDDCRTFVGIKGDKHKVFGVLAKEIQKYFTASTAELSQNFFDDWHKRFCDYFINQLEKKCDYHATYGQAQKVVNMAFKYLFCCDGINEHYFDFCHMPLDSITLKWYSFLNNKTVSKVTSINSIKNYDMYINIQNDISNYLLMQEKLPNNRLKTDFIIWNNGKN